MWLPACATNPGTSPTNQKFTVFVHDQAMSKASKIHRSSRLDVLRGLCALIVVLYHVGMTVPGWYDRLYDAIWPRPVIAGPSAVFVFFVLSGYVLYIALIERGGGQAGPFLRRRFGRIYPPIVVAVFLGWILSATLRSSNDPMLSAWASEFWARPLGWGDMLKPLLLSGDRLDVDPPLWSVVIELQYSLAFPLIARAVLGWGWRAAAAALAVSVVAQHLAIDRSVLRFLFLFAGGAALAHDRERYFAVLRAVGPGARIAVAVCSIGLLSFHHTDALGIPAMVGGLLLVAVIACEGPEMKWMDKGALLFLGQISYSLYLVHMPIILGCAHLSAGFIPLPASLLIAVLTSLIVASAFWRWVEHPSILYGQRLGSGSNGHRALAATAG